MMWIMRLGLTDTQTNIFMVVFSTPPHPTPSPPHPTPSPPHPLTMLAPEISIDLNNHLKMTEFSPANSQLEGYSYATMQAIEKSNII